VNLQLSTDNGATWTYIATGVPLNQYDQGTFAWTPTADEVTTGNTALIRAIASITTFVGGNPVTTTVTGQSQAFLIAPAGNAIYVNSGSTGGQYTTAGGNDANSGKDAAHPLASLQAALNTYQLVPGEIIYVDSGTYQVFNNLILTAADNGITIQGATAPGQVTVLNRANTTTNAYLFDFEGASGVNLRNLDITGAGVGVMLGSSTVARNITIANSNIYANSQYGVEDNSRFSGSGTNLTLTGDTVHNNAGSGVYLVGAGDIVQSSQIYGNAAYGLLMQGQSSTNVLQALNNSVHDNTSSGIYSTGNGLISGNEVYGETGSGVWGIYASYNELVTNNKIYKNTVGLYLTGGGGVATGNYVYANTGIGIRVDNSTLSGNHVFSNTIGISDTGYTEIDDNVIYGNANAAIAISGSHTAGAQGQYVRNNTIYQPGGDGIQVAAGASNVQLYNNIIWVAAGSGLKVGASQTGFVSDYNLFYTANSGAVVGTWNSAQEVTLANWRTASGQDAHSKFGDPLFLNPAGADQVLGEQGVSTGNGFDDNFGLRGGSPAINAGNQYVAPITDINGNPRHTDPSTPATGIGQPIYAPAVQSGSTFNPTGGTSLNYQANNGALLYTLPFAFNFYGVSYTQVYISTDGFLQFAGKDSAADTTNTLAELQRNVRIAPFWAALNTYSGGSSTTNLFADTSVSGQVTIRWAAVVAGSSGTTQPVNFSVTLFQNGNFRFDYGNSIANVVTPLVGVSAGDGRVYALSSYSGSSNLSNAASLLWTSPTSLTSGIGAYEFQGDSSDHTAPQVTGTTNLPPNGGTTADGFTSIQVNFSKTLDQISASSPANYVLIYSPSGVLGAPDNTRIALTPVYTPGQNSVTLKFANGVLANGLYELIAKGVYDTSGNLMQGNGGGTGADQYVVTFTIDRSHNVPPVASNGTGTTAENQPITIALSSTDPNGEPLTYRIVGQPQHGTLSAINTANNTVIYTPNTYFSGTDSFQFQVDDGRLGISTATVSLTVTPVNQVPVALGTNATTNENVPVIVLLPGSDIETPQPYLTYNLGTGPQHGTLTQGANGVWTYTPNQYFFGTDTFTYTVTDRGDPDGSSNGAATSAAGTVTITVNHVNQPPAIGPIGTQVNGVGTLQANEGSTLTYTIPGSDPDVGAVLQYTLVNNTVAGAKVDPNTGVFTWTPAAGPLTQSFTVQVTYGTLTAQATFNVVVAHVAPTVSLSGASTVQAGQSYTVNFSAVEVGTHTLTGWLINWGDGSNSSVAGTATSASHVYAQAGSYGVVATVSDDVASYATQPLTVQVSAPASPMVVTAARMAAAASTASAVNQASAVSSPVAPQSDDTGSVTTVDDGTGAAAAVTSPAGTTDSNAEPLSAMIKRKPSIVLGRAAPTFTLSTRSTHGWLDEWVSPDEDKGRDGNTWSISVKHRTVH
jgi:hypothetical protein